MNSISNWTDKEIIAAAIIPSQRGAVLELDVPLTLPERRIYLYLEVGQSAAAAFTLAARINALNKQKIVGIFPATIADFTSVTPNQSVVSLLNAGGSPVGDSLTIRLAQPFVALVTSVVIQPLRINAEIEKIQLIFDGIFHTTVTGYRAYLGCLSTKY